MRPPGGGGRSIRRREGKPRSGRWPMGGSAKAEIRQTRAAQPRPRSRRSITPAGPTRALGGAARQHVARVAPRQPAKASRRSLRLSPMSASMRSSSSARRIASWRFFTLSSELLEAAPRAAGGAQIRPKGRGCRGDGRHDTLQVRPGNAAEAPFWAAASLRSHPECPPISLDAWIFLRIPIDK